MKTTSRRFGENTYFKKKIDNWFNIFFHAYHFGIKKAVSQAFGFYTKNARIAATELVKPSEKYRESFLAAAEELRNDTSRKYGAEAEVTAETFDNYVKMLEDYAKGVNLPPNYVPSTDYWLVDGNEYIGRVSIRHRLNGNLEKLGGRIGYTIRPSKRNLGYGTKILEIALPKAKKLGLEKVLLTCNKTNIASAKIIEKNGGKFQDEQPQTEGNPAKLRYWIDIR